MKQHTFHLDSYAMDSANWCLAQVIGLIELIENIDFGVCVWAKVVENEKLEYQNTALLCSSDFQLINSVTLALSGMILTFADFVHLRVNSE